LKMRPVVEAVMDAANEEHNQRAEGTLNLSRMMKGHLLEVSFAVAHLMERAA